MSSQYAEHSKRPEQNDDGSKTEAPRPCCVCKETRSARDDCYFRFGGEGNEMEVELRCKDVLQAHIKCLQQYGFEI